LKGPFAGVKLPNFGELEVPAEDLQDERKLPNNSTGPKKSNRAITYQILRQYLRGVLTKNLTYILFNQFKPPHPSALGLSPNAAS
jgi:hypothetical protein